MKKLNQFSALPVADQELILELCSKNTYKKAAELLAKSRSEGGLDVTTNASALCRYYTANSFDGLSISTLGQHMTALQVRHQADGAAIFQGLLALIQCRVAEALRSGKALSDITSDLRNLERAQKMFLADDRWRCGNDKRATAAHTKHLERICDLPDEVDYVRNNIKDDPGADGLTADYFDEGDPIDDQIEATRQRLYNTPRHANPLVQTALEILQREGVPVQLAAKPTAAAPSTPAAQPSATSPSPSVVSVSPTSVPSVSPSCSAFRFAATTNEISRNISSKTPVISQIAPNFTNAVEALIAKGQPPVPASHPGAELRRRTVFGSMLAGALAK